MDFDEIEIQQPKFPKISKLNGKSMKISNEEEKGADRINGTAIATNGWISSRIVRVSRLTGGKDRHSKVLTSKGLRDRRVRLSVSTAIQFYDLQDRLGFDQPSKALEWLLKAAASSITELPPMSTLFPDGPNYDVKDDNAPSNGGGKDVDSATSDTSKNSSGLTLCRSDSLNHRGRINDTKLGEIENENAIVSQTTSFTELLSSRSSNHNNTSNDRLVKNELNVFEKIPQRPHWPLSPMDYLTSSFLTSTPLGTPVASPMFSFDHHHLSLPPDNTNRHNLCSGNEYNLNFTMSSSANSLGLTTTGLNRGTLQSNSTSSQRLIPLSDGGSPPSFYVGAAENHHQFVSGLDGRFHLSYGDAGNNNGQKGKRKN